MAEGWSQDDDQRVTERLLALCELHGKVLTTALARMYMAVLRRMEADAAVCALENAFLTLKWFPKPSELIELSQGSLEEKSYHAWNIFLDVHRRVGAHSSVFFEDGRMSAVIDMFGGWIECKKWLLNDLSWRRTEFLRAYQAMKAHPKPHVHQGLQAIDNHCKGFFSNVPDPVIVDSHGEVVSFISLPAHVQRKCLPVMENDPESSELMPLDALQPKLLELLQPKV
jgi:hypothetical protein